MKHAHPHPRQRPHTLAHVWTCSGHVCTIVLATTTSHTPHPTPHTTTFGSVVQPRNSHGVKQLFHGIQLWQLFARSTGRHVYLCRSSTKQRAGQQGAADGHHVVDLHDRTAWPNTKEEVVTHPRRRNNALTPPTPRVAEQAPSAEVATQADVRWMASLGAGFHETRPQGVLKGWKRPAHPEWSAQRAARIGTGRSLAEWLARV